MLKVMRRFYRRWWNRLGRYPRIVNHQHWTQLRNQLPREQRKAVMGAIQVRSLVGSLRREKHFHREKVKECDQLKTLLREHAPFTYGQWLDERRANPTAPPQPPPPPAQHKRLRKRRQRRLTSSQT